VLGFIWRSSKLLEEYLAFEDKNDEDLQKKVRFSAYYNLAFLYYWVKLKKLQNILMGKMKAFGMRTHHPFNNTRLLILIQKKTTKKLR
jgi:hypothetical protein